MNATVINLQMVVFLGGSCLVAPNLKTNLDQIANLTGGQFSSGAIVRISVQTGIFYKETNTHDYFSQL